MLSRRSAQAAALADVHPRVVRTSVRESGRGPFEAISRRAWRCDANQAAHDVSGALAGRRTSVRRPGQHDRKLLPVVVALEVRFPLQRDPRVAADPVPRWRRLRPGRPELNRYRHVVSSEKVVSCQRSAQTQTEGRAPIQHGRQIRDSPNVTLRDVDAGALSIEPVQLAHHIRQRTLEKAWQTR